MDTYVFAGGGSGGHLFPAIAVARELQRRDPEARIVFVGGQRPVEAHILGRETFERRVIRAASSADLRRNPLRFAWRNWRGYREAVRWLKGVRPRVVIGCGGYASVPVALAASRLGVPLVLLEQNVVPGRATSWLARRAQAVCTSFEETAALLPPESRVIVTGNPVRVEIARRSIPPRDQVKSLDAADDWAAAGWPGLEQRETTAPTHRGFPSVQPRPPADSSRSDGGEFQVGPSPRPSPPDDARSAFNAFRGGEGEKLLLVLGGSQGAAAVNRGVLEFVAAHRDVMRGWRIVHQAGHQDESSVRARYAELAIDADVRAFIADMAAAYADSDAAVSRAGATTLAELACAGLPAVLVPYPGAVRDHQRRNAVVFERDGAAVCAADGSGAELAAGLLPLLTDPQRRETMSQAARALARPDATERVVEALQLASGGVQPRRP